MYIEVKNSVLCDTLLVLLLFLILSIELPGNPHWCLVAAPYSWHSMYSLI